MKEIRLLLRLSKVVNTPREALILVGATTALIAVAYLLPPDIVE